MRSLLLLMVAAIGCGDETFDLNDPVALGKAYVAERKCGSCHDSTAGALTGSETPAPDSATAYAANLTSDIETGLGGWADIQIIRAIRFGVDDENEPLCPPMPSFNDMSDLEARAIVAYLRSLPAVPRPNIPGSVCPPIKPAM